MKFYFAPFVTSFIPFSALVREYSEYRKLDIEVDLTQNEIMRKFVHSREIGLLVGLLGQALRDILQAVELSVLPESGS